VIPTPLIFNVFFFNDTAATEIYTLSLHDALPIYTETPLWPPTQGLKLDNDTPMLVLGIETTCDETAASVVERQSDGSGRILSNRSEEHTSELQSRFDLVCRLLLEKKK